MRFDFRYEIQPAGIFGVPEERTTVVPGKSYGKSDVTFPPLDSITFEPVGHGTVSEYRPPDAKLSVRLQVQGAILSLEDNYLTVSLEADSRESARATVKPLMDTFFRRLALTTTYPVYRRGISMVGEDGHGRPISVTRKFRVRAYAVGVLKSQFEEAADLMTVSDTVLERGLMYLQFANLLFERLHEITYGFQELGKLVMSSIYLNLWKSVTIITGESRTGGSPDNRLRELGFDPSFYRTKVKPLNRARHTEDVAHATTDEASFDRAQAVFREGRSTAEKVIRAYAKRLKEGDASFALPPESND